MKKHIILVALLSMSSLLKAESIICEIHPFEKAFQYNINSTHEYDGERAGREGGNASINMNTFTAQVGGDFSVSREGGNTSREGGNTGSGEEGIDVKLSRLKEAFPGITELISLDYNNPYQAELLRAFKDLNINLEDADVIARANKIFQSMPLNASDADYEEAFKVEFGVMSLNDDFTHRMNLTNIHDEVEGQSSRIKIHTESTSRRSGQTSKKVSVLQLLRLYIMAHDADPNNDIIRTNCGTLPLQATKVMTFGDHSISLNINCCLALEGFNTMLDNAAFRGALDDAQKEILGNEG